MFSRSRFLLFVIFVVLVFPITIVFAQSGGTEGDPPPIVETNPEVQDFHVYLPMLSKVVLTTDVAIADVQLNPNPIAIGETVHLSFSITNLGLTPSVEFPVDWKVVPLGETEPLASGSFVVPPLSYGQIVVLEADYQALIAGPFDVQVVADPFFENPDPIPANNSRSVELGVTGIVEFCGTITKNTVWAYATYVLGCNAEVPEGISLLVRSGAVIKPTQQSIFINVLGNMELRGTETTPVVITSINDEEYGADANGEQTVPPSVGEWNKVFIGSTGVVNTSHALLRYGLTPFWSDQGHLIVSDSVLEYFGAATQSNNGYIDLQNNVIRNSGNYGLIYYNNGPFVAVPTMINNHFEGCTSYAVMYTTYGEITMDLTQVHGNTAINNGFNGIRLTGTIAGNSFLSNAGIPYILEEDDDQAGSIFVPVGSTLTIEAGAIFKMTGSSYWYGKGTGLEIAGTLLANGTIESPVVFTSIHDDTVGGDTNNNGSSTAPTKGDWTRQLIQPGGTATFEHVMISYAGGSVYGQTAEGILNNGGTLHFHDGIIDQGAMTGIRSINNGILDVSGSTIRFQNEHGIVYAATGAVAPTVKNNIFDSNTNFAIYFAPTGELTLDGTQISGNSANGNGTNALRLIGNFVGVSTLQNPGFAIFLDYNPDYTLSLNVSSGSTLTIQPGTIFKGYGTSYDYGRGSGIVVSGTLNALGTEESPIVFTSLHDDSYGGDTNNNGASTLPAPGQWTMNLIGAGGVANLDHTLMRYAGGLISGWYQQTLFISGGILHLSDSTIEFGSGSGVRSVAGGVIEIHDNMFKSNTEHGIVYSASGAVAPIIQNNTFDSNANFAIYFAPSGELTLDGTQISGNSAINNGTNALRLIGNFVGNSTLQNPGFPIYLDYNPDFTLSLNVSAGNVLTIQPGTIFKGYGSSYWEGRGSGIQVSGTLNALGTTEDPITFTSLHDDEYGGDTNNNGSATVPAAGQWSFNYIGAGGTATFEHTLQRYGGGMLYGLPQTTIQNMAGTLHLSDSTLEYGSGSGVRSDASGVIDIHDNLIKSNTEYGIYYSASGSLAPIIQNNTFDSNASYAVYFAPSGSLTLEGTQMSGNNAVNNAFNALRLIGNFVGSSTLQNPGFAIMLHYNPDHMLSLYVPVGSSLTIQPGTILKGYGSSYWEGRGSGIEVYGTLNVAGTSEDPVVFTSLQDDAYGGDTNNDGSATVPASGQWSFNYIGASGTATFEHTLLRYAGAPIYGMPQPAVFNSGGSVSLTSSVVKHSANYGILQNGGELSLTASQVSNNVIGVSIAAESGSTSFVDCDFLTNQIGIDFGGNSSTTTQNCIFEGNAQYGYRNQTSLTLDVTNNWWGDASGPSPYGTGDPISGNLTVSPWLTVKPR